MNFHSKLYAIYLHERSNHLSECKFVWECFVLWLNITLELLEFEFSVFIYVYHTFIHLSWGRKKGLGSRVKVWSVVESDDYISIVWFFDIYYTCNLNCFNQKSLKQAFWSCVCLLYFHKCYFVVGKLVVNVSIKDFRYSKLFEC